MSHRELLQRLKTLLDHRPDLRDALKLAIEKADYPDVRDLGGYIRFLEALLTRVPNSREMDPATTKFHYIVNSSPDDVLMNDGQFQQWLVLFSREYGHFLDTAESAAALGSFIRDPSYVIDDYYVEPGGWLTFNQFFARRVKPGRRPIASSGDDRIVISPTDSRYLGCWPVDQHSVLEVKGTHWKLADLLGNALFANAFAGGVFTHSYLDVNDYHRYHLPIGGKVETAYVLPGSVQVSVEKKPDGQIVAKDDIGFQFSQTRGVVILESSIGLVALIPVGMGHVSSVNLVVDAGDQLAKGQEFGFFAYGGSDMIMLFQSEKVRFTASPGKHYKQGEQLAVALPNVDTPNKQII